MCSSECRYVRFTSLGLLREVGSRVPERNQHRIKCRLRDCSADSLDPPGHALRTGDLLWLADFPNAHLCPPAARHLEDMAIRRRHFKSAILVTKNLGGIYNFDCAVDRLDHCAPQATISKVRRRH